jgi:hypothetical protein
MMFMDTFMKKAGCTTAPEAVLAAGMNGLKPFLNLTHIKKSKW